MPKKPALEQEVLVFDFGHDSVMMVHADVSGAKPKIKNFVSIPCQSGTDREARKEDFKKALVDFGCHQPRVVLTWEEGMGFRQLTLPAMPEDDLKKAVHLELKDKFSLDTENSLVSYDCVFESESEGAKEKTISVFLCDRKASMEKIEFVQSLGLEVLALVPAQATLAEFAGGIEGEATNDILVFDVGYQAARILIARNKKSMLSRSVPLGGHTLTQMLTGGFMSDGRRILLEPGEAEKLKIEQGAENPQAAHISLLRPYLDRIVAEIKRSVDYYEGQKHSGLVSKVLFTGGGANLRGMKQFMAGFLGMEVLAPNAEDYLSPGISGDSKEKILGRLPSFVTALGAASLRGGALNLAPREIRHQAQEQRKQASLRMAVMVCAILLTFLIGSTGVRTSIVKTHIHAIDTEWNEIRRIDVLINDIAANERLMRSALKGDMAHHALFGKLSLTIPDYMALEEVEFNRDKGELFLKGVVSGSAATGVVKLIAGFTNDLIQSPFFKDASFRMTSQEPGSPSKFEIAAVTKGSE